MLAQVLNRNSYSASLCTLRNSELRNEQKVAQVGGIVGPPRDFHSQQTSCQSCLTILAAMLSERQP